MRADTREMWLQRFFLSIPKVFPVPPTLLTLDYESPQHFEFSLLSHTWTTILSLKPEHWTHSVTLNSNQLFIEQEGMAWHGMEGGKEAEGRVKSMENRKEKEREDRHHSLVLSSFLLSFLFRLSTRRLILKIEWIASQSKSNFVSQYFPRQLNKLVFIVIFLLSFLFSHRIQWTTSRVPKQFIFP